jgi:integrase
MNAEWMKKLLDKIRKAYAGRGKRTGEPLTNPPNSFTREQYIDICETLHRNGLPGVEQVALLTLDFILIGRIGEIEDLRWKHLEWSEIFKV